LRASLARGLRKRDQTGFLKDPQVRGQVAVGHAEQVPEVGVAQGRGRRQGGDNRQSRLFVNDSIQLEYRFWIHVAEFFSVHRR